MAVTYLVPMAGACGRRVRPSLFDGGFRCGCAECLSREKAHVHWRIEQLGRLLGSELGIRFYVPVAVLPGPPPEGEDERKRRHKWLGDTLTVDFALVPPKA